MNKVYKIVIICATAVSFLPCLIALYTLPPSIKVCHRSSPNLVECVRNSIENIRPVLKTGDFGDGFRIDPIEPLDIQEIVIQRGPDFYVRQYNLKAFGAVNFQLKKLRASFNPLKIEGIIEVPQIDANGLYDLDMKLGPLHLKGQGKVNAHINRLKLRIKINGSKYIKDGEEFVKADNCVVAVKLEDLQLNFSDLFNGNKVLSDVGNQLINDNIDLFIRDIEPSLEKSLAKKFLETANQVLEKAPFRIFLPD
ncbi:CLUMA_CG011933, isoform A [Clunio marinus]|uniref:CLUMA_CG011933, isoform A n=1 Tax=Clunio marinus TaxID=568069 RepID=A0A1J1IH27_9DIPT|nr:CLUMA_CG011933, isoform A [Clunio marinus]